MKTLSQHIADKGKSQRQWAADNGFSQQSVSSWCGGAVPNKPKMKRIFIATGGEVQPNSFFPMADWHAQLARAAASNGVAP